MQNGKNYAKLLYCIGTIGKAVRSVKNRIFAQSVAHVVRTWAVKRELGENPMRLTVAVCVRTSPYPSAKAGHWETEKAGYGQAPRKGRFLTRESLHRTQVGRPALMSFRKVMRTGAEDDWYSDFRAFGGGG